MAKLHIDPWYDHSEWEHVRDLVLARDTKALQYMTVWRSRSMRLPAGVETTVSLLEASLHLDNSLALSMSINRFLNHISHIGMNVWGVSKLHAAAERLQVPGWIVDIRHETTHGQMPSLTILRSGFEVCWSWICTNYWENQRVPAFTPAKNTGGLLGNLLECYLYLRVYQSWGTMHVKDIAENSDVYSHIRSLWNGCAKQKSGKDFTSLTVKQAAALMKQEITNQEIEKMELARILVDEDLLVPEQSFLQSLVGDDEEDHVEIPKDLMFVWKEYVELIDDKVGAKLLIDLLIDKISQDDVEEHHKEFCAAWVVEISEGLLGHSSSLTLKKNHGVTIGDLEKWISRPNRLVQMLLPCFCSLVGLGKKKESLLDSLLTVAVGDSLDECKDVNKVFTVDDLGDVNEPVAVVPVGDGSAGGWKSVKTSGWGQQVLQTFPNQSWDLLWLSQTAEWLPAQVQSEEEHFEVVDLEPQKVVWPGDEIQCKTNVDDVVPLFYRENKDRFYSPRRKKVRRN